MLHTNAVIAELLKEVISFTYCTDRQKYTLCDCWRGGGSRDNFGFKMSMFEREGSSNPALGDSSAKEFQRK